MFNEIVEEIDWGAGKLTIKTGKVARQSDGAVVISMGGTVLLCTTVSAKEAKEDASFFPLTVHYREMAFAAGKIPGGFLKREGRASDREVLVSRLIDRPIRPLFHPAFLNETQVICTVLSYDRDFNPDILAIIGASAAIALSGVPFLETVAAARVGHINGEFVLNPSIEKIEEGSKLDLVIAGTESSVMMVESEVDQLSEEDMISAIAFGHNALKDVIGAIRRLAERAMVKKWPTPEPIFSKSLCDDILNKYSADIKQAFAIKLKQERVSSINATKQALKEEYQNIYSSLQLEMAFEEVQAKILRSSVLDTGIRIDGRKSTDIRQIECEVSILPKTHGSALFTRGETQGLVVTTLGTAQDEQIIDSISGDKRDRFMLQYLFPPYSVGEATPLRAPGRREVGHGKLAWRALNSVMPTKEEFPYSVRVVSEITESNGSSSMATVCGGSLAMMDAGIPLKAPVSGIAMGLIKEGDRFIVLSDILGDEDYLGDMDFKVAGTPSGITALQMDIKVAGITLEIMQQALAQAKIGRAHILECMSSAMSAHRTELSQYAPTIKTLRVHKDKIREIIGPGGKVIKDICEKTGAKIDINDEGVVEVSAVGAESLQLAVKMISDIAFDPEIGQILDGTVVKIIESGIFVNYAPSRDGFVHISEISDSRVNDISEHVNVDDKVKVKITGVDPKGRMRLSMRLDADHSSMKPHNSGGGSREGEANSHNRKRMRDDRNPRDDDRRPRPNKGGSVGSSEKKHFN